MARPLADPQAADALAAYSKAYEAGEHTEAYRLACENRDRFEWVDGFPKGWSGEARAAVLRGSFEQ